MVSATGYGGNVSMVLIGSASASLPVDTNLDPLDKLNDWLGSMTNSISLSCTHVQASKPKTPKPVLMPKGKGKGKGKGRLKATLPKLRLMLSRVAKVFKGIAQLSESQYRSNSASLAGCSTEASNNKASNKASNNKEDTGNAGCLPPSTSQNARTCKLPSVSSSTWLAQQ
jgi:hypothetical protein